MARKDSSDNASDSSKKVARAARAGATPSSSTGDQRSVGFPMALAGIIVAGSALVFFAWNGRDVAALQPTFGDHWHLPFGMYDCTIEDFRDPLIDPQTSNAGIHTHGDGVIHLHPISSTATGNNATLDIFLEATEAELDGDTALTFANDPAMTEEGVQCGGEDAVLQVARFAPDGTTATEVVTENLGDFKFQEDFEQVVLALAPEGFEIPPPPTESQAAASAASPNVLSTEGLTDLDGSNGGLGFDDDGVLIGPDGEPILDDDGEPITRAGLEADLEASTSETETDAEEADE